MDLLSLITELENDDLLDNLINDPFAQFGDARQPLLGPTVLPERNVPENVYEETQIRYRTVIANDGSRYSPSQKKSAGFLVGSFLVQLGGQDIAVEMDSRTYDAILEELDGSGSMEAIATAIQWFDVSIVQALVQKTEVMRWQAIVDAEVVREGDNGFTQTVTYPDPSGHRAAIGGAWTSDANDPWDDIFTMVELLDDKGYSVTRIITSTPAYVKMARNANVIARAGNVQVLSSSDITPGQVSQAQINAALQSDGLPPIELYNARYRTEAAGSNRYLQDDVMVFVGDSGRDEAILDEPDTERFLPDVLGYTAIGRGVGQPTPGRVGRMEAFDNKPPRIEAEGWQTALPVITEPEAFAVLTTIT